MALNNLLRDLRELDRPYPRNEAAFAAHGQAILDVFLRNAPYDAGAVYLRHPSDQALRLAAKSGAVQAPDILEAPFPAELVDEALHRESMAECRLSRDMAPAPATIVPLRHQREHIGVVALTGRSNGNPDFELLTAASYVLATQLANQRMATEVRDGDFQLKYRLWELESLYDIGLSIASTLDLDRLADEILVRTVSLLNARRAALFLRRGDLFVLHRAFGEVRPELMKQELEADLTASMEQAAVVNIHRDANCVFPGCQSFIAIPIRNNEETIGVLAAADREVRTGLGPFEEGDVRLLSQFATQVGIALENTRLHREALEKQAMERELEVAATIQRDILPRSIPELPGFELASLARPARRIGGDYHTYITRPDRLSVCVADVSGKSVPAAILVSALHAALQLLFSEERNLGDIATELNRHIHRWSSENKFITLVLATIDRTSEQIHYVNAGHNPAFLVRGDATEVLASHGLPIGMMSHSRYAVQVRAFPRGSVLALYSDGITEAENLSGDEFGEQQLLKVLQKNHDAPCAVIRDEVGRAVDEFVGQAPQKDDQTLVLVRTS